MVAVNSYLYDLLGINVEADEEAIKKAYKKAAKKFHRDKF